MADKFVDISVLCRSFGTDPEDIPGECIGLLTQMNKGYKMLSGSEKEKLLIEVLEKIENDTQVIGAPKRTSTWHEGWQENLDALRKGAYNLDSLMPKFLRKGQPIRFMGDYIVPEEPHFEHTYFDIFRTWLFKKYFSEYDYIYDIGCGSSYNLIKLCKMFPDKKVYGFDFVQSSVDIVNELAKSHRFNAEGRLFNLIEPDTSIEINANSVVFTSGAIEQIASKFEKFVDFLLDKKPNLVVHIEPTYELYDQTVLFDYLAAKFHKKRGYTQGYLPKLQELEKENKIEIIKTKRLNFGSLFMEGYNLIIWKPL